MKIEDVLSIISGIFALLGGVLISYSLLTNAPVLYSVAGQISVAFAMVVFGLMHHIRGEDDLYHAEMIGAVSIAALSTPTLLASGLLENLVISVGVIGIAASVAYIYHVSIMPEIKKQIGIK